jgi:hypothetical protein
MIEFYIIYRDGGEQAPTFKHFSKDDAYKEAERLANKHAGSKFYVLRTIASCIKQDVIWEDFS